MLMKSQVKSMRDILFSILADIERTFIGRDRVVFQKDYDKITLMSENRGYGFFTIDLPNIDAVLLDGLRTGVVSFSGPLMGLGKTKVPKFLQGLWRLVFSSDGYLLEDACPDAIACLRQVSCVFKSISEVAPDDVIEDAIKDYQDVERHIRPCSGPWNTSEPFWGSVSDPGVPHFRDLMGPDHEGQLDLYDPAPASGPCLGEEFLDFLQGVFDGYAAELESRWGDSPPIDPSLARHGPGAVSNTLYDEDKWLFSEWPSVLESVFPYDVMVGGYSLPALLVNRSPVPTSRLVPVPKTRTKVRLICSEPSYNMWCQQAIRSFLERNLGSLKFYVNFKNQNLSKDLAREASIGNHLSTIDLSSASDRLSLWVVERAFRASPTILNAIRSSRTQLLDINGELSWKRKAFTQGTALTFPVQTIIFSLIALSALRWKDRSKGMTAFKGQLRVFGDDIIVPKYIANDVVTILTALGLKVNESKTFIDSHFKESCGGDYFKGYDVTPTRMKVTHCHSTKSSVAMLDTSNNFHSRGWWLTASRLRKMLGLNLAVSRNPLSDLSFFSFCEGSLEPSSNRRRFNHDLQRWEHKAVCVKQKLNGQERHWASSLFESLHSLSQGREKRSSRWVENPRDLSHSMRWDVLRLNLRRRWVPSLS